MLFLLCTINRSLFFISKYDNDGEMAGMWPPRGKKAQLQEKLLWNEMDGVTPLALQ